MKCEWLCNNLTRRGGRGIMAISRQWRSKAISALKLLRQLSFADTQVSWIFWLVSAGIKSVTPPLLWPYLFIRSDTLYEDNLSKCWTSETKAAIILWFMSASLRAEDGADSQWCRGEKNLGNLNWRIYEWWVSCMEVWHTICMYHGNSGAPGAGGVSHRGARVVCLFNLAPPRSTCFAKEQVKSCLF